MLNTFLFGGNIFVKRISRRLWWTGASIMFALKILYVFLGFYFMSELFSYASAVELITYLYFIIQIGIGTLYTVKRFHDRNKNLYWGLLLFTVPAIIYCFGFFNSVILNGVVIAALVWVGIECGFLKGTKGDNRFGADPLTAQA